MRQSHFFTKTLKNAPSDEEAKNAQLLIRAGYIHKEMAGAYMLLPLGMRVVEKIKQIVREEMNAIGGQEFLTTSMQRKELWERTGRWSDEVVDVWFKSQLHSGGEIGFAWSHEEPIADMMRSHISSYKDLPVAVYQFQNKLRNELRAKSGLMRGREFLMKDMYSFARGEADHTELYEATKEAYMNVFRRLGLGDDTFVTFASGGAFTQFSHEFQTACEAGEDVVYVNREKGIAINQEVLNDETLGQLGVTRDELTEVKTAEVGNIFNFGRQKAEDVGLFFNDEDGSKTAVWMGSYGIGITRLVGVLAEKRSDERGLVWDKAVAPYSVHLVTLGGRDEASAAHVQEASEALYAELTEAGVEVLWDDREGVSPGAKFADSDLMGIPLRLVVSERNLEAGEVEWKGRTDAEASMVPTASVVESVQSWIKG